MTGRELRNVLLSPEFHHGLEEVSSYLASIIQERPIVHLIAKCLWKQKHLFVLERFKRHDLTVWPNTLRSDQNETTLEFKFSYDCDMIKLQGEMKKNGDRPWEETYKHNLAMKRSMGWDIALNIHKDVVIKKPDIFVWIICGRDLSKVGIAERRHICWEKEQREFNEKHSYADPNLIEVARKFLEQLKGPRRFDVSSTKIETNGSFPSTYDFLVCEFPRRIGSS